MGRVQGPSPALQDSEELCWGEALGLPHLSPNLGLAGWILRRPHSALACVTPSSQSRSRCHLGPLHPTPLPAPGPPGCPYLILVCSPSSCHVGPGHPAGPVAGSGGAGGVQLPQPPRGAPVLGGAAPAPCSQWKAVGSGLPWPSRCHGNLLATAQAGRAQPAVGGGRSRPPGQAQAGDGEPRPARPPQAAFHSE